MRSNGSVYVAAVFAALAGYFVYQWWFNPARAIKQRLGQVAAALSAPATDSDIGRLERLAALRRYLADDIRVDIAGAQPIASRDAVVGAVAALKPPAGGVDVQFVDTQVNVDSESTGHAYLTVEVTTSDRQTAQPTVDSREAVVTLARRGGEWVITSAASRPNPTRP